MSQDEDEFWTSKILETRHSQLDTVRKAATSWSTLFTAILGVFGTVTFVSGLTGLDTLSDTVRGLVRGGIAIAAVATLAATILAGSASNSIPKVSNDLTIDGFRSDNKKRAAKALKRLQWSMFFGALAAAVVISGSIVVLFADKSSKPDNPPPIIAVVNGRAICGTPSIASDGTLAIGSTSLNGATSLIIVAACPRNP